MEENTPALVNPLKDPDNPRSVINISPSSLANQLKYIPESIFEMGEKELREAGKCGELEDKLRIAFWREYEMCQNTGKNINLSNVFSGNCSQMHFLKKIITNSFKLAYILTAPPDYVTQIIDIYLLGMRRMRSILEVDPVDDDGFIDAKLAEVQRKITEDAHLRYKGAIPYKVIAENTHTHISESKPATEKLESMEQIEARIKELRGEVPLEIEVKEVTSEESERES